MEAAQPSQALLLSLRRTTLSFVHRCTTHTTARAADSCLLRQITHVSPQIGNLSKLTEFVPYTSYNLHWLPYEVHDTRLPKAHISRRAMYGYSDRLPLPRLAPFPTGACRVRACVRCRGSWLAARLMVVRQVRSRSRRPPHAWWCPTAWTKASSPPSWSITSTRPTAAPIATSTSSHVRSRPPQTRSCSLTGGLVVPAQAVLGDELSVLVDLVVRPGAAARSRVLASVRGPPGRSRCTRSCNVKQDNFRIFSGRSGRARSPSVRSHSRLTAGTHRR